MGAELFEMNWVQSVVLFFSYLGWALFATGLVVAVFECGIEYSAGRGNVKETALNVLKGFLAVSLFTQVPVRLYSLAISLQGTLTAGITGFGSTSIGDAAKAALATWLGLLFAGREGGCIAAVFAVVGHMFPLYFGFRGGKGIACTVGAVAALYPILLLPLAVLWAVPVLLSRCISLGSIIAGAALTPAVALWCHGQGAAPAIPVGCAAVMTLLILWAHRENMVRLARGEENKI